MSTRAHVIVTDGRNQLCFYQHSDGYPDGLGRGLNDFIKSEKAARHESDIEYFCGMMLMELNRDYFERKQSCPDLVPAVGFHGDEQYIYTVDCNKMTVEIKGK